VNVRPKGKDGIDVNSSGEMDLDEGTVKGILRERGFVNANVTIRGNPSVDRLVDGVMDNRVYMPSLVAVNKVDLIDPSYAETMKENLREQGIDPEDAIFISAAEEKGLDTLKERIWEELGLIRIYMDKPGRGVDYEEPLIVREGDTVDDALRKLGGTLDERFRFARVTGPSGQHDEQQVGRDHELADEDILRVVARR